eukprot:jgi/Ulvmu1/6192/UM028_0048.1
MGKSKKKASNGSSAKAAGVDPLAKDSSAPLSDAHSIAHNSRIGTAPSTPEGQSPAMAVSRQSERAIKHEQSGASTIDPPTNGKAVNLKNGKGHTKAAPLPPGFLESELQLHKRKLKSAETAIDTHREEIAALRRQLAEVEAESRELRSAKAALESACRAASDAQAEAEIGVTSTSGSYRWLLVGVSVLSVSAVIAMAAARCTTSQHR